MRVRILNLRFYKTAKEYFLYSNYKIVFTWAGPPNIPVAKPHSKRPANNMGYDWDKAKTHQPANSGNTDTNKADRLPIKSAIGPDKKEPIGVAKLWTLAKMKHKIKIY